VKVQSALRCCYCEWSCVLLEEVDRGPYERRATKVKQVVKEKTRTASALRLGCGAVFVIAGIGGGSASLI
jgi:hypothetical protein